MRIRYLGDGWPVSQAGDQILIVSAHTRAIEGQIGMVLADLDKASGDGGHG